MIDIVTLKDIFKAMCNHIKVTTGKEVDDSDITEPIDRPALRIFMDTTEVGFYSANLRQVKVYFNIYYYAANKARSKSEIFDIEDKLGRSFLEPFYIKEGCAVYIDTVDFEKVEEGILNCSFNFEIATGFVDESNTETMFDLVFNLREE